MSLSLLDNIVWHALTGPHAGYASGTGGVRRYRPGISSLTGFADPARPDLAALTSCGDIGDTLHCSGWAGPLPDGWQLDDERLLHRMVWADGSPLDDRFEPVQLGRAHLAQMQALAELTEPGPFGAGVLELGTFIGWMEGPELVAMAGERLFAGGFREISAVCTHPDHRGQGLARRLVRWLVHQQMQRGEQPFLQVMDDNPVARQLYQRIGFRSCREVVARTLTRLG